MHCFSVPERYFRTYEIISIHWTLALALDCIGHDIAIKGRSGMAGNQERPFAKNFAVV